MMRWWGVLVVGLLLIMALPTLGGSSQAAGSAAVFAVGKGINLDGWFVHSNPIPEIWQSGVGSADLRLLRTLGITFVRFPVEPQAFIAAGGGLDRTNLPYLDAAIALILRGGLNVVLDIHPDADYQKSVLLGGAPLTRYLRFISALAGHLVGHDPHRLALEPMNEPFNPQTGACDASSSWDWNPLQQRLWRAARRAAPRLTLVVTGPCWSGADQLPQVTALPDPNLIYTFHFYTPMLFTHQGATWAGDPFPYLSGVPYPATAARVNKMLPQLLAGIADPTTRGDVEAQLQQYAADGWDKNLLREHLQTAVDWGKAHHLRLFLGEFGVYKPHAPVRDRYTWVRHVREIAEGAGVGWAMWEYNKDFGLLDDAGNPDTCMITALGLRQPTHGTARC